MKLVYCACFYQDHESGAYAVVVPDLPGCTTGGEGLAEAIEMATDAASGWVLDELENGKNIPLATPVEKVELDPDMGKGFVAPIVLDMDRYTEKYGKKSIRKNLTVPNWLNTKAEQAHINFSQVLKEALMERLGLSERKGA
ncbi:MAG: HicB family protein [Clostridia bacterium]|nr:HicB family protein [Clostridia bacterium]NCC75328.1 HicB family protein [Clostridia bacterium]